MEPVRQPPRPYDPDWPAQFDAARRVLWDIWGDCACEIHHIGSTAIPGIYAKPVIDILIEVTRAEALDQRTDQMICAGFKSRGENGICARRFFTNADDKGVRTHHIHVFAKGSPNVLRHLAFRDYLRAHAESAAAYSQLKQAIVSDWRGVDDYIARKAPYVEEIERAALNWTRAQS